MFDPYEEEIFALETRKKLSQDISLTFTYWHIFKQKKT